MGDDKHSVLIDGNLYRDIKDYCNENSLQLSKFVSTLLKKQFMIEKYGDTPFSSQSSFIRPKTEAPPEKAVEVTERKEEIKEMAVPTEPPTIQKEPVQKEPRKEEKTEETNRTETVTIKPRKRRLS